MIAAIIAGGKGKRLKDISKDVPKPMVPVGGKPVLEHQIELLSHWGVTDIHLLTGYLGHVIREYFGDGRSFGVRIYYHQEEVPLGTSGGVRVLADLIQDPFILLYGDILLDMKLDDFLRFHKEKSAAATLAVHPNDHPYDSDLVVLDVDGKITAFTPTERKPRFYENRVSAAVYVLSPSIFRYIPKGRPSDFVRDVFPAMLAAGEKLYGYRTTEYIKDMGTTDRYEKVNMDLESGRVRRLSRLYNRPAIFLDRDGTLVEEVDLLHRAEDLCLYPFAATAVKQINQSDYFAFVVTNQPVVARNLCNIETVRKIHRKLETLLGEKCAYLDDIFFCPHHPDRGYPEENPSFKVDCECRKPKTGMIDNAFECYPVSRPDSWIIGDRTSDIQTGLNAGIQTVLVRTGIGGKDRRYQVKADFEFDDLEQAINFIVNGRQKLLSEIDRILNAVSTEQQRPFVLTVAGQARSGKSTFVKLVAQYLTERNISSKVLNLDHWLISANERTAGMTVRERYRYEDIKRDIRRFLAGETIGIRRYDPYTRGSVSEDIFSLGGVGCLIVEGVPALDIKALREVSLFRIYLDVSENLRMKRFFSFYRWKDISEEKATRLYRERMGEEYPLIEASKRYAQFIIRM